MAAHSFAICLRQWQPTPVLLLGKSHGQRSLVGFSPWGREELDTTERLHFHFSLSCTGEGNGSPLQCSCLENPGDGGAWWAAVYGVAQSRTWLKWLSSSSRLYLFSKSLYILKLPSQNTFSSLENWWVDEAESCTKLWGQYGTLSKAFSPPVCTSDYFSHMFKGF